MNFLNYKDTGFAKIKLPSVKSKLNNLFNEKIISINPTKFGKVNLNLEIETNKIKYLVKISPLWYKYSLGREKWAINTIRSVFPGVSIIYKYLGPVNRILPGHEILILYYIRGTVLQNIDDKKNISTTF